MKAALKDFGAFPEAVQRQMIAALRMAAGGEKAKTAKPMKGLGSGIFEIAVRHRGDAFRAVYAVHMDEDVWVLHAFQKARSGIRTPKAGDRPDPGAHQTCAGATTMSEDKLEIVRGTDNPFADAGLPDADTELMKADLATAIVRILRERDLSGARAAELAGTTEADVSRIRRASLDRFTIDRLVKILNRLDRPDRGGGHPAAPRTERRAAPRGPSLSEVATRIMSEPIAAHP